MSRTILEAVVPLAGAIAAIAINALWQDALLVLGVWSLLRLWPSINAATRYTVWSATLIAAVVVPLATTLPFIAAPPSPVSSITGVAGGPRTPILTSQAAAHHTEPSVVRGAGGGVASETLPRVSLPRFPERFRLTLPLPLAIGVFAIWAILSGLAMLRLTIGIVRLERLKRDALPLPIEYRDAMTRWNAVNKGSREVRLCVSDEIDVPVAIGLFDAMILIPKALLELLSQAEVDQISLHELAHLRRADDWSNGFARLLLALLAWNPAAQFAAAQLDLEREVACDDWVLSLTGAVRPYALTLTKMAETASWPHAPVAAPGVFASRKHISLRIERLLGAGRNVATSLSFAPAAAAIAVVGALAGAIAFVAPSIAAPVALAAVAPAPQATPAAPQFKRVRLFVIADRDVSPAPAAAPARPASPAPPATPATPGVQHMLVPGTHVHVPARTIHIPAVNIDTPDIDVTIRPLDRERALAQAERRLAQAESERKISDATRLASEASAAAGLSIAQAFSGFGGSGPHALTVAQNARICSVCNLRGKDLSGQDLHGAEYTASDLSYAKLRGTDFSGGTFKVVDFAHADLRGASFRGASLTGVDFSHADLTGVDFTGAKVSEANFSGTNLANASIRDVLDTCNGCDFNHSAFTGADLSGIHIQNDAFTGADLRNVNFSGTTITGVDFSHARLDGANLAGATLDACDLSGVALERVDLSKTHLIGVNLPGRSH
ncbi:MAG TPA: pentapeptide repeat-containing protein [Verrucomicrobiae bacterium]|nr:pentapeptide repeat-containing protein [Verrucomicrobiae bacterium]